MSYDRYSKYRTNGQICAVPMISLKKKSTDYTEIYTRGVSSLNNISFDYYGDANYDWLIMLANPEYGSMEYEIPDGSELVIPYPLVETLEIYNSQINEYNILYGIGS